MAALPKTEPKTEPKTDGAPEADASGAGTGAPSKGRGKLLIIVGIAVAVLGIGGGAAFYFLRGSAAEAPAEDDRSHTGAQDGHLPRICGRTSSSIPPPWANAVTCRPTLS